MAINYWQMYYESELITRWLGTILPGVSSKFNSNDLWQHCSCFPSSCTYLGFIHTALFHSSILSHRSEHQGKIRCDNKSCSEFQLQFLISEAKFKAFCWNSSHHSQLLSITAVNISTSVTVLLSRQGSLPEGWHKSSCNLDRLFNYLRLMIKAKVDAGSPEQLCVRQKRSKMLM